MFIFSKTKPESIVKNKEYLKKEIEKAILPIYFALHNSDLEGTKFKTIRDFQNKIYRKINKYYEERS